MLRLKLSSVVLLVLLGSGLLAAAGAYPWLDARGGLAPSAELAERRAVKAQVKELFSALDLESLEALAAEYRGNRTRTPSGVWKLTLFYGAIHEIAIDSSPEDEDAWTALIENLRIWREQHPESPTPLIASAIVLKRLAWNSRPTGLVQEASLSSEDRFAVALRGAFGFLESSREISASDPHFYVVWAGLAAALGEDEARFLARIEEGLAREPGYYQTYFAALDGFAGADGQGDLSTPVEAIANMAVERTRPSEGDALYARLYWYAARAFWKERIFDVSRVDWLRMKRGIEDVLARYPDDWNTSHFARLACLKGDAAMAGALLARLPEAPLEEVWQSPEELSRCRALARGGT